MADIRNSYPGVKQIMPNLIFVSHAKPKVHTYAFIKTLRESDWGKEIPLIFIEDDSTSIEKTKSSLEDYNIDSILTLPFDKKDLKKLIEKLILKNPAPIPIEDQETIEIKTIPFEDTQAIQTPIESDPPIVKEKENKSSVKEEIETVLKAESPEKKISNAELSKDIHTKSNVSSKIKKLSLYLFLVILLLVIFPLSYLKFKPILLDDDIVEKSEGIDNVKKEEISIKDQLVIFSNRLEELRTNRIVDYLPDEYSNVKDEIGDLRIKSENTSLSKKELMENIFQLNRRIDSLSSQLELAKTKEKSNALSAIEEAEEIIKSLKQSKFKISSDSEIQRAKSGYYKAKKLSGIVEPNYKKVYQAARDSIEKLMKLPEYNFLKLQDEETIKLRADADYFYKNQMYVFPEKDNALKSYQKILDIHPTNQHAKDRIKSITNIIKYEGDKGYETGDMSKAYVHYKEYLKLVPDDETVVKRLNQLEEGKQKQIRYWDLVKEINPLLWVLLVGFVVALYKFLPILIEDMKNAYILVGLVAIFLLLILLFI